MNNRESGNTLIGVFSVLYIFCNDCYLGSNAESSRRGHREIVRLVFSFTDN